MKQDKPGAESRSFSYRVNVGRIAANPVDVTLQATGEECAELAKRWGVESVEAVSTALRVSRWKRDGVRVKGTVDAALTQACVVTLEPVASHISETIDALFVPENSRLASADLSDDGEIVVDADGPDAPETFAGDSIDVADLCAEYIVLAIDPYPRAEGAVFQPDRSDLDEGPAAPSPFAKLQGLGKPK